MLIFVANFVMTAIYFQLVPPKLGSPLAATTAMALAPANGALAKKRTSSSDLYYGAMTAFDTRAPGRMPQLTSDRPNWASSAAIAKSQAISWVKPPPKQKPLTMAMVGFA